MWYLFWPPKITTTTCGEIIVSKMFFFVQSKILTLFLVPASRNVLPRQTNKRTHSDQWFFFFGLQGDRTTSIRHILVVLVFCWTRLSHPPPPHDESLRQVRVRRGGGNGGYEDGLLRLREIPTLGAHL
jgi:hypothetical protein